MIRTTISGLFVYCLRFGLYFICDDSQYLVLPTPGETGMGREYVVYRCWGLMLSKRNTCGLLSRRSGGFLNKMNFLI